LGSHFLNKKNITIIKIKLILNTTTTGLQHTLLSKKILYKKGKKYSIGKYPTLPFHPVLFLTSETEAKKETINTQKLIIKNSNSNITQGELFHTIFTTLFETFINYFFSIFTNQN
jgi:hypothetical protein